MWRSAYCFWESGSSARSCCRFGPPKSASPTKGSFSSVGSSGARRTSCNCAPSKRSIWTRTCLGGSSIAVGYVCMARGSTTSACRYSPTPLACARPCRTAWPPPIRQIRTPRRWPPRKARPRQPSKRSFALPSRDMRRQEISSAAQRHARQRSHELLVVVDRGIRRKLVHRTRRIAKGDGYRGNLGGFGGGDIDFTVTDHHRALDAPRSEERRVGKECRPCWAR